METDPNNPVVRLCAQGISAGMGGRADDAKRLYQEAWEARTDDYEASIVAHYLARVQRTPDEVLNWNRESLRYADAVNDERVAGFYPSLYLNMGKAYEDLGKRDEARKFYGLAEGEAATLPEGKYGDMVRHGVAERLEAGGGMRGSPLFECCLAALSRSGGQGSGD
jgi:tetratricopeptide (TPR) repeat protein